MVSPLPRVGSHVRQRPAAPPSVRTLPPLSPFGRPARPLARSPWNRACAGVTRIAFEGTHHEFISNFPADHRDLDRRPRPGRNLTAAAGLLPATQSANTQLLGQWPAIVGSLEPHSPGGLAWGFSVTCEELGKDRIGIVIRASEHRVAQACPALVDAVSIYLTQSTWGTPCSHWPTVRKSNSHASTGPQQQRIDSVLAEIYVLASVVQRLGGSALALATLLKHAEAAAVARMFGPRRRSR